MRSSNELRRFARLAGASRHAAGLLLALAAVQVAHAQTAVDASYDRFRALITGNTVAVNFGSTGTPLAAPTTGMQLAAKGLTPTAGELARYAAVNTKYGPATFRVSQSFTLAKLASGVAAVATNPLLAVGLAVTAPYIADWLQDSGVAFTPEGAPTVQKSTYTCMVRIGSGIWSASFPTCIQAANSMLGYYPSGFTASCTEPNLGPSQTWVDSYSICSIGTSSVRANATWQGTAPAPATLQDVQTAVTSNARTLTDIENIISESAKLDVLPTVDNPTPTIAPPDGQSEIKSPSKTDTSTTTNPDGSSVEEVKSCWVVGSVNLGSSMTMREVCNTTKTTKDASGNPTGTTTTTTESGDDPATLPEDRGFCDSLVGKLLCADLDTPEEPVPERSVSVSYNPLNLFGAGSCPAPRTYTSVQTGQTHTASFQPICDALALLRPMFLAIAAFIAYMILLPKGAD